MARKMKHGILGIFKFIIKGSLLLVSKLYGETLLEHALFVFFWTCFYGFYRSMEVVWGFHMDKILKLSEITHLDLLPVYQKVMNLKVDYLDKEIHFSIWSEFTRTHFYNVTGLRWVQLPGLVYVLVVLAALIVIMITACLFYKKSNKVKKDYADELAYLTKAALSEYDRENSINRI